MINSKDGFTWTQSEGRQAGLPTIGVVQPPAHSGLANVDTYDVIVIGAGYAGLVASRDLATQGKTTLLLEGRDRIGGRTWSATIDGFNYEIGGTWIHWHMPHIYREVSLYGLQNDWTVTQNPGSKEDYCTITTGTTQRNISHDEEASMAGRVYQKFCNLDGSDLRESMKYIFGTNQSPRFTAEWDKLSCQDRIEQIKNQLTPEEMSVLKAQLIQMGGNSLDKMGLLDALRWWALGGHTPTGLNEIALHTRLRSGQSELHRRIFQHALSTKNLAYSFNTPVQRLQDNGDIVTVTARDGTSWRARSVICTVPLNVLSSLVFSPPLPDAKIEAAREGSVNKCNKIHVDFYGPDYLSWTSLGTPGKGVISAFGDHLTPAGDSHVIAFGPDPESPEGISLADPETIKSAVVHLLPKHLRGGAVVNRIVSHDWNADEFSKGAWCYLPPKLTTKYLAVLQKPHGNVYFASADWSDGWRGWIDGAVQSGSHIAKEVIEKKVKRENMGLAGINHSL